LIGTDEVRAMVETLDAHGPTIGAELVTRDSMIGVTAARSP
jgi:hypothetical protein